MPSFNAMPFLRDAVNSVCRQTYRDWELIVVDDGSTDQSKQYLKSMTDSRIRVIYQRNQGPSIAFNRGFAACESEFVARMDADDVSAETRFAEQVAFLRAHPEIGLVGAQYEPLGTRRVGRRSHLPVLHDQIFSALLKGRHAICNPTVMCRTSLLRQIGGYRADGVLEDWAMFLGMGQITRLANLDRALLRYRIHAASTNTRHMAELRSRIAYACDRASRVGAGDPAIEYSDFLENRKSAPLLTRVVEGFDVRAMVSYRQAQAEILGGEAFRGYLRLALAAFLSPSRSWERVTRGYRNRRSRRHMTNPD